ncbi:MAG: HEAT repeat domain-containing protein [Pirellulaceae bacterium]|nr:HEAT repeat domain-containing protein [Pirellulaceae bacterium]
MLFRPVCFACVLLAVSATSCMAGDAPLEIHTRADLEAAIARLSNAETKLSALEALISFGSLRVFQGGSVFGSTGDAEKDALIQRAADAVAKSADFETIRAAIHSSSENLQYWALFRFPMPPFEDGHPWEDLLSRLRQLARSDAPQIRESAQNRLSFFSGQREFLAECLAVETSASNLMKLLYHLDRSQYRRQTSERIAALLHHADPEVRKSALGFVGFNSQRAAMWQIEFHAEVLNQVLVLSRSESTAERSSAVYALSDLDSQSHLRGQKPGAIRARLIELADDPSTDVRWQVAWALRAHAEDTEGRAALVRLLRDESPRVQYFAILASGPEHHIGELRELASCSDAEVAEYAAGKLRQLEPR